MNLELAFLSYLGQDLSLATKRALAVVALSGYECKCSRFECVCEFECECLRARVIASANGAKGEEGCLGASASACVRVRVPKVRRVRRCARDASQR